MSHRHTNQFREGELNDTILEILANASPEPVAEPHILDLANVRLRPRAGEVELGEALTGLYEAGLVDSTPSIRTPSITNWGLTETGRHAAKAK